MYACTHNMYMNIYYDCTTTESLGLGCVIRRFVSEIDLRDKNSIEVDILVFESRKVHLLRIVL